MDSMSPSIKTSKMTFSLQAAPRSHSYVNISLLRATGVKSAFEWWNASSTRPQQAEMGGPAMAVIRLHKLALFCLKLPPDYLMNLSLLRLSAAVFSSRQSLPLSVCLWA